MSVRTARRRNLERLIAEAEGVAPLARRAGVNEKYLRQILGRFQGPRDRKPRELGDRVARQLESACGRPEGWMDQLHPDGAPEPSVPEVLIRRALGGPVFGAVAAAQVVDAVEAVALTDAHGVSDMADIFRLGPDEVWIPRHDGIYPRMGSGDGAMNDGNEVVTLVKASETGLRQRLGPTSHTGVANLRLVTARGDSMRGTFEEGDLLLVDTGVNEVLADGVFLLRGPEALLIKRVQKKGDGSWLLLSDNPRYQPDLVPREARAGYQVLGRVLLAWASRTV
jgi:hypothetical protein